MDNVFVSKRNGPLKVSEGVRLADLPFYKQICNVVRPIYLKINSELSDSLEFYFTLSPLQCKALIDGQKLINERIIGNKLRIIMRFCLNVPSSVQYDNLPPEIKIIVNEIAISIPLNFDLKRPLRPLDITNACNLTLGAKNSVRITWKKLHFYDLSAMHCLTISIMEKLCGSYMSNKLKNNCTITPEFTRFLIKKKLVYGADADILTTSLRISLICPLGKTRLKFPSRSIRCDHVQCFDALTYLLMNDKTPTWFCPVCDQPAEFESLVIDGLFNEILSRVKDVTEVEFFENGDWKPFVQEREDIPYGKHRKVNLELDKEIITIDLTFDSDDDED